MGPSADLCVSLYERNIFRGEISGSASGMHAPLLSLCESCERLAYGEGRWHTELHGNYILDHAWV